MPDSPKPLIGITVDVEADRLFCRAPYVDAVVRAGGIPILLPPTTPSDPAMIDAMLRLVSGVILTGGDDPRTEPFGAPTHPAAKPIDPRRQAFECAVLDRLDRRPELPVLGICLGMQMLALHAGGRLDQHLPDHGDRYAVHWGRQRHAIDGSFGTGVVTSHHRQAVVDPGRLTVVATAPDEIVEAVLDAHRPFVLGVQWHPEITDDEALGIGVLRALIAAAQRSGQSHCP